MKRSFASARIDNFVPQYEEGSAPYGRVSNGGPVIYPRYSGEIAPPPPYASFNNGSNRGSAMLGANLPRSSNLSQLVVRPGGSNAENARGKSREFESPLAPLAKLPTINELQTSLEQLRAENVALKAEVHRLRKIEAGWFPPRDGPGGNVTVINSYEQYIDQYIEEINHLRAEVGTLQGDNAQLSEQVQSLPDEAAFNEMRAKLSEAQFENSNMLAEMQQLNQLLEAGKERIAALQAQIDQMNERQQEALSAAQRNVAEPLKETISLLREENQRVCDELDEKRLLIVSLEARLTTMTTVEHVVDHTGIADRDRLIEHYKYKWDDIRRDNVRLRNLLLAKEEEVQRVLSNNMAHPTSQAQKEREAGLVEALKTEIAELKDDVSFYKKNYKKMQQKLSALSIEFTQDDIREEMLFRGLGGKDVAQMKYISKISRTYEQQESDCSISSDLQGSKAKAERRRRKSRHTLEDLDLSPDSDAKPLPPKKRKPAPARAHLKV